MHDRSHKEDGEFMGASNGKGLGEGPADEATYCVRHDITDSTLDAALDTADDNDTNGDDRCDGTTGLSHPSVSFV
jgi:hypothetical protein